MQDDQVALAVVHHCHGANGGLTFHHERNSARVEGGLSGVEIVHRFGMKKGEVAVVLGGFDDSIRAARERLGQRGRLVIRPSGTEPVIRVMAEAEDPDLVDSLVSEVCEAVALAAA